MAEQKDVLCIRTQAHLSRRGYVGSEHSKEIKRQRNTKTKYFEYIIKMQKSQNTQNYSCLVALSDSGTTHGIEYSFISNHSTSEI